MDKQKIPNVWQRFGRAAYFFVIAVAIIMILVAWKWVTNEPLHTLLLNLSTELIGVAVIFFLVNKLIGYDPIEERIQTIETLMGQQQRLLEQSQDVLKKIEQTSIQPPTTGTEKLFKSAIDLLNDPTRQWEEIRIYAPVGLWEVVQDKKEWFENLATALVPPKGNAAKLTKLLGVFGLPPKDELIDANLSNIDEMLYTFRECPNAWLYFIPPGSHGLTAAPGLGMIIFDHQILTLAFAREPRSTLVDAAIQIEEKDIVLIAQKWFDNQPWHLYGNREFCMLDKKNKITYEVGIRKIYEFYGKLPPAKATDD